MGITTVVVHRAELHAILREALPTAALLAGVTTTSIRRGADGGSAEVRFRHLDHDAVLRADLVVGADGVHSWVRAQRWPDAPAPVYSGSASWRAVTASSSAAVTPSQAVLPHDIYRLPKLERYYEAASSCSATRRTR